jgi:hypothetical protein
MSKIRISLIAVFAVAALSTAALAQQAQPTAAHVSPIALSPPKVGAASVPVAPANPHRAGLYVSNPNPVVTVWVSPTGTPAAVNGAGSIAIQPQQGQMFGPPNTPAWTNGMNAAASSGDGNPISILEY